MPSASHGAPSSTSLRPRPASTGSLEDLNLQLPSPAQLCPSRHTQLQRSLRSLADFLHFQNLFLQTTHAGMKQGNFLLNFGAHPLLLLQHSHFPLKPPATRFGFNPPLVCLHHQGV
ncbi:hypothetical protein HanHA300_Chr05g0173681 [Helianthus annuus]|nr:hypothetical protein HanHA300_Chr05g0173681 [Helianthus annuus]KAJ0584386.1 hypothetical protein HanHA89_Chr05g0187971 [Helianthus annuus]